MFEYLAIFRNRVLFLLFIGIIHKSLTIDGVPNMCLHESRFDSLTQFIYFDNINLRVAYFFTSRGYYWILSSKEYPSSNNTRGRLPHEFRGDAAFFRQWKRCDDQKIVPIIVVVDGNETDINYMLFFIHNQTWSRPYNASEDPALSRIHLYEGIKSVDTIMNFANIKVGPFADKLGDESIFIISTSKNKTIFYDWVRLEGCVKSEDNFEFKGNATNFFGPPLQNSFWKMNKSIDTAMVYIIYPNADPTESPKEADISLFQENTHYLFSTPLNLIENGLLVCNKEYLLAQYYSTWMGCAEGLTPEPPIQINPKPTKPSPGQTDYEYEPDHTEQSPGEHDNSTWRPPLDIPEESHNHIDNNEDVFVVTIISALIVLTVVCVLIIISYFMFFFNKKGDQENQE